MAGLELYSTRLQDALNWGRKYSLFQYPFVTACCGMEFMSLNGPRFYRLPPNERRVTLLREATPVPKRIGDGDLAVAPFRAGESLRWHLAD